MPRTENAAPQPCCHPLGAVDHRRWCRRAAQQLHRRGSSGTPGSSITNKSCFVALRCLPLGPLCAARPRGQRTASARGAGNSLVTLANQFHARLRPGDATKLFTPLKRARGICYYGLQIGPSRSAPSSGLSSESCRGCCCCDRAMGIRPCASRLVWPCVVDPAVAGASLLCLL